MSYRKSISENRKERSRSKSKPLEDKPIQVWDTKMSPFRSKYEGETSNYSTRKRYHNSREHSVNQDDYRDSRKYDDETYQNRYSRQNREYSRNYSHDYNRYDTYDNRMEDRVQTSWRRPYGKRGGYRGSERNKNDHYGDGSSSRNRDDDRDSSSYRNKVKLVDY